MANSNIGRGIRHRREAVAIDFERGRLLPERKQLLNELHREGWINLSLESSADVNVIMFDCGLGDSCYSTWVGRTPAGGIACFVTDLRLLSDEAEPITQGE
jgi:hypothetical protein